MVKKRTPGFSAPSHLSRPAQAVWRTLRTGSEDPAGLLRLEFAAVQVVRAREAQRLVDAQGVVAPGPSPGCIVAHPAVAVERAAHEQFRKWSEGKPVKEASGEPDADGAGWVARMPTPIRNTA